MPKRTKRLTAYTPGPWHVAEGGFEVRCNDPVGEFLVTVAACYTPALDEEERKANVRLIAAAPELLAACEAAKLSTNLDLGLIDISRMPISEAKRLTDLCELLASAINKAKGQTNA